MKRYLISLILFIGIIFNCNAGVLSGPDNPTINSIPLFNNGKQVTNSLITINGNIIQNVDGSQITNMNDSVVRTISMIQPTTKNTNWFGPWTSGTKTSGIQEAINSISFGSTSNAGGGRLFIRDGLYKIGMAITNPISRGTYGLNIEGASYLSTIILQTNSIPMPVFSFNATLSSNSQDYELHSLGIMSVTNATTNLVQFIGPILVGDVGTPSIIGSIKVDDCFFNYWGIATNNIVGYTGIITPEWLYVGKKNLCAIYVSANYNGMMNVRNNFINNCGSVWFSCDSPEFWNNQMVDCGGANDWPSSDPRSSKRMVIFTDPPYIPNNIHEFKVGYNHFVNNASVYLINASGARTNFNIYDDSFEIDASSAPVTLGTNNANTTVTLYNPDINNLATLTNNYLLKSTTDYVTASNYVPDTNGVPHTRLFLAGNGFAQFPFNALNPFNVFAGTFIGNGGSISNLNITVGETNGTSLYDRTTGKMWVNTNASVGGGSATNGLIGVAEKGVTIPTNNQPVVVFGEIDTGNWNFKANGVNNSLGQVISDDGTSLIWGDGTSNKIMGPIYGNAIGLTNFPSTITNSLTSEVELKAATNSTLIAATNTASTIAANQITALSLGNLSKTNIATFKTYLDGLYQPLDSDLTTWAGITPATGVGTFLATPSSANFFSAITDEIGTSGYLIRVAGTATDGYGVTVVSGQPTFTVLAAATTNFQNLNVTNSMTVSNIYVSGNFVVTGTGSGTLSNFALVNVSGDGSGLTNIHYIKAITSTNGYFTASVNSDGTTNLVFVLTNTPSYTLNSSLPATNVNFTTGITNFIGPTNVFVLNNSYQVWNTGTNVALTNIAVYGVASYGILTISNTSASSISVFCTNIGTAYGSVTTNAATIPGHKTFVISVGGQSGSRMMGNAPGQ